MKGGQGLRGMMRVCGVQMRQVMNWISENCKVQQVPRKLS